MRVAAEKFLLGLNKTLIPSARKPSRSAACCFNSGRPASAMTTSSLEKAHIELETSARILLADDDFRLLDSLHGLLKLYGHDVEIAVGGKEAINKLNSNHYDLLLLDLRMPEISGHDVMQHMAQHNITTMTVVVSGETSIDDISRALRNGAYDYLKKPYVPEELLATVNNAVTKKRLEDANRVMEARLNRSEKLHRCIVNNSPDIIYILDEEGHFSFLNSKVEQLLGYDRNELLGLPIISIIEEDDLEKARYFFEHAARTQQGARSIEIALRARDPNQSKRYFELAVWPVADSEDLITHLPCYRIYGTARDITDRMEAEAFINFQAYHDLLTRLPNRSLFKDRLSMALTQAARNTQRVAVMFIDLDRFKIINDSLGHTMGDRLLQAVSQRLLSCIRKGDTLSRFGGDEFTLLLHDTQGQQAVVQVAEKILETIREPFRLGEHDIHIGASIGIAIYPEGGDTLDGLIKNADIAMYRVKNTGKDGYHIFSHDMTTTATHRLMLEQDMRRALENDEFEICYQPQMDVLTEQLIGVEALIRWNHPTLGRLAPADFIPVAEDSRLIIELDRLTLSKACREIALLHRSGHGNLKLSVNLSPLLLERTNFVENILEILAREQFPAHLLELEITENLLMNDRPDVIEKLQSITAAGVQLAIDDFGTGYSSLSYLQKFPINTLKIDRSFIHAIKTLEEDACIVNAIISMALGLKLNIIAEGVENAAQLQYLRSLGCHAVQGYLFGEPEALANLMATHGEKFKAALRQTIRIASK
ncbi:MAG: two-component system response regulator [Verrucomicrobiaceae bacterium]|nr:two-component system response regulator [Verrucomicrobiaceae bacterium]